MNTPRPSASALWHWILSEATGTFFLSMTIVGVYTASDHGFSGFSGLFAPIAPAALYFVLTTLSGSLQTAHYNPVTTIAFAVFRRMAPIKALVYIGSQLVGAYLGIKVIATILSPVTLISLSTPTTAAVVGEFVGAFLFIWVVASATHRIQSNALANGIGSLGMALGLMFGLIGGGAWLNPAVSIALNTHPLSNGLLYVLIPVLGGIAGLALAIAFHESKNLVSEEAHGDRSF